MAKFSSSGKRQGKFSLADSSDLGLELDDSASPFGSLTHRGVSVASLSDAQLRAHGAAGAAAAFGGFADDDDGTIGTGFSDLQFGGGLQGALGDGSDGPLSWETHQRPSRKEQLRELVQRQRHERSERAKEADDQQALLDELDSNFAEVRSAMFNQFKRGEKRNEKEADTVMMDDFERTVRELRFDVRAAASDRLKTNEELALEQRERLEASERERLARMKDGTAPHVQTNLPVRGRRQELQSVEDLRGDESNVRIVGTVVDDADAGNTGSDESSSESSDSSDGEEAELADKSKRVRLVRSSIVTDDADLSQLPFSFASCPSSVSQLDALIGELGPKHTAVVLHRVLTFFNISLDSENKNRLRLLLKALLEYFIAVSDDATQDTLNSVCLRKLNALMKPIFNLTQLFPEVTLKWAKRMLEELRVRLIETKIFPELSWLSFLALLRSLYPVTDFVHRVNTPALLLACQMLTEIPNLHLRDVTRGLFVCNLVYAHVSSSRRYVSEALQYLTALLARPVVLLGGRSAREVAASALSKCGAQMGEDLFDFSRSPSVTEVPALFDLLALKRDSPMFTGQNRLTVQQSLLKLALELVQKFASLYSRPTAAGRASDKEHNLSESASGLASFPEVFSTPLELCRLLADVLHDKDELLACAATKAAKTIEDILSAFSRTPLVNALFLRPVGLAQLNPRFLLTGNAEDDAKQRNFTGDNLDLDPDIDRRRQNKLKRQVRRESRSAARELRRDAEFIQREKGEKRKAEDRYKAEQRNRITAMIQSDNAQFQVSERSQKRHKGSTM